MQRYILRDQEEFGLSGDNFHHAIHVMRLHVGSQIILVSKGQVFLCRISHIEGQRAEVEKIQLLEEQHELPIQVTLLAGLTKSDKFEWMIQKATELGVHEIVPFLADRSIVKWDSAKSRAKITRWQTIAKEAAEQCHRNQIPTIKDPITHASLNQFVENFYLKIVADEEVGKQNIKNVSYSTSLRSLPRGSSLLIVVGPEGGFSEQERKLFSKLSIVSVGLGPRILRAETAPLYLLSTISYHYEQMESL